MNTFRVQVFDLNLAKYLWVSGTGIGIIFTSLSSSSRYRDWELSDLIDSIKVHRPRDPIGIITER